MAEEKARFLSGLDSLGREEVLDRLRRQYWTNEWEVELVEKWLDESSRRSLATRSPASAPQLRWAFMISAFPL